MVPRDLLGYHRNDDLLAHARSVAVHSALCSPPTADMEDAMTLFLSALVPFRVEVQVLTRYERLFDLSLQDVAKSDIACACDLWHAVFRVRKLDASSVRSSINAPKSR